YLNIHISDNGIGISADEIDKIFVQFYNNRNANKNESNGIGLALTKDLIELHKGLINVVSDLGKGTKFSLQIPIDKDSYEEVELKDINEISFDESESAEPIPVTKDSSSPSTTDKKLNLLLV